MILLAFVGCKCPECLPAGTDTETVITIHKHDTTIITQPDSAQVRLLLRCDSANNVLIDEICAAKGEHLRMELQLQALATGGLAIATIDCKEDSLEHIIQWQDSVIRSKTTQTIVRVEKQKDFVYYCGWILIALVIASVIAAIIGIVLKFAK